MKYNYKLPAAMRVHYAFPDRFFLKNTSYRLWVLTEIFNYEKLLDCDERAGVKVDWLCLKITGYSLCIVSILVKSKKVKIISKFVT